MMSEVDRAAMERLRVVSEAVDRAVSDWAEEQR
jgi:hypothetical protein